MAREKVIDYETLAKALYSENKVMRERITTLEGICLKAGRWDQAKPDNANEEYTQVIFKHDNNRLLTIHELSLKLEQQRQQPELSYRDVLARGAAPPVVQDAAELARLFCAQSVGTESIFDNALRFLCARTPHQRINSQKLFVYWAEHPVLHKIPFPEGHIKLGNLPPEFTRSSAAVTPDLARIYVDRPDLITSSGEFTVVVAAPRFRVLVEALATDKFLLHALTKSAEIWLSEKGDVGNTLSGLSQHLATDSRFASIARSATLNFDRGNKRSHALALAVMSLAPGRFVRETEGFIISLSSSSKK